MAVVKAFSSLSSWSAVLSGTDRLILLSSKWLKKIAVCVFVSLYWVLVFRYDFITDILVNDLNLGQNTV
jgi:hypothetical protein